MLRALRCGVRVVGKVNDFNFQARLDTYINQARKRGGGYFCCISGQIVRTEQLLTVSLRIYLIFFLQ